MGLHTGLISGLIVTGTDMPSLLLPELLIKSDWVPEPGFRSEVDSLEIQIHTVS